MEANKTETHDTDVAEPPGLSYDEVLEQDRFKCMSTYNKEWREAQQREKQIQDGLEEFMKSKGFSLRSDGIDVVWVKHKKATYNILYDVHASSSWLSDEVESLKNEWKDSVKFKVEESHLLDRQFDDEVNGEEIKFKCG
jgi:hypothetical protein